MNIALQLSYDGSAYHGWQRQKNAVTVCEVLENTLGSLTGEKITLHGCGRTDAGVHAKYYVANFRSNTRIPIERLPYAINSRLPYDIAVQNARQVPENFDAIGSCIRKEYCYHIHTGKQRDPFLHKRVLHYPHPPNIPLIRQAAKDFVGQHDFACVRTLGTPVKSTVRTLYALDILEDGENLVFRMSANGFLYNMARAIAGTLLYVSEGKITHIPTLIASGQRSAAGPVLPPHGLYMTDASYDWEKSR